MQSPRAKRILIGTVAITGFAGTVVGAALLGIAMAKRNLGEPDPANSTREPYPVGVIVTVGGESEPVFFSADIQRLRDYWFAFPSAEKRREAEVPSRRGIRKLEGGVEVRTLRQDADAVEVDVLTGEASGDTGWIHHSQLPAEP